jgi:molecular chaperone DnaK
MRHIIETFRKETGINIGEDLVALQRIREAAERAKCELSSVLQTDISLPYIASGAGGAKHLQMSISRADYEKMTRDLVQKTLDPCGRCLKDAGVRPADINEVVMVGGMTRTPAVLAAVREFFHREPFTGVNPDEVVALGAATQGSFLAGKQNQARVLIDVTPLSLGIETMGGIFARLIPRNSVVPCRAVEAFSTAVDGQTQVQIRVFQGERDLVSGNKLLGDFTLEGITPLPKGVPRISVIFEVDANAILHVKAFEKHSGKEREITITQSGSLSQGEMLDMIAQAKKFEEEDAKTRLLIEKKLDLENYIVTVGRLIAEYVRVLPADLVEKARAGIGELEDAIKSGDGKLMDDVFRRTRKITDRIERIARDSL